MNWNDLEDQLHEAIQRCCQTDEDKEKAIIYFKQSTVEDIINDALEE